RRLQPVGCAAVEKVIYRIEHDGPPPPGLSERLRGEVAARLLDLGARAITVNVVDDDVAPAASLRMVSSSLPPSAVVSVWMDSATDHRRAPFDDAVAVAGGAVSAYLVTESVPLSNERYPVGPGERVPGMAQVVFLRRVDAMATEELLR